MRISPLALIVFAAVNACGVELPPIRAEARGCRLRTTTAASVSTALPEQHCAFRDRLTALTLGPVISIDYVLTSSFAESRAACAPIAQEAGACAQGGFVIAPQPMFGHELVHAVLLAQGLEGTAALQEGAADVFGTLYQTDLPIVHSLGLNDLVDATAFRTESPDGYRGAASFVSFLLDRGGEDTFFTLLARTRDGATLDSLDLVARELYGESMRELHAAWVTLPEEPSYSVHRPVYECGAPDIGEFETVTLARGVSPSIGRAGAVRSFRVDTPGELHVRVAGAPSPAAVVLSCARGPLVLDVNAFDARELDMRAPIGPGRYAIWITATLLEGSDDSADVEVTIAVE